MKQKIHNKRKNLSIIERGITELVLHIDYFVYRKLGPIFFNCIIIDRE